MVRFGVFLMLLASLLSAQNPETITNEIVMKMVAAGVPAATIIRTIDTAPSESFSFLPNDLSALGQAKVPEDVFKAMAARANRITRSAPAGAAIAVPNPAPVPTPAPTPQPKLRRDQSDLYQSRGMWNAGFQGSISIPHTSASSY
jgi:hypothetical protein